MTGDFTRDSFEPAKGFTRVVMQQGRPQLDADLNEQTAIFWHYWRTFVSDLVGPYAGPHHGCGFGVITREGIRGELPEKEREALRAMFKEPGEFLLDTGHYYVDGILCENKHLLAYSAHCEPGEALLTPKRNVPYLVYLDVWERPVTALEDASIPEPALNGIDTSLRAKIVWRVRIWELPDKNAYEGGDCNKVKEHWKTISKAWQAEYRGRLRAQVSEVTEGSEREHRYQGGGGFRGPQNHLYRVEVHHGGGVGNATFKVSRENGSVAFRIAAIDGNSVTIDAMGRDERFGVQPGDWVEIGESTDPAAAPGPLWQVQQVKPSLRQIMLTGAPKHGDVKSRPHLLQRWDHKAGDPRKGGLELRDGAAILKEGEGNNGWLALEEGLRIQFHKSSPANVYRPGDYWLIPARIATGGIIWPHEHGRPRAVPPHGVEHHYAPLAIVSFNKNGVLETQGDCRLKFRLPVEF
jgi:hypothetical protein